MRKLVDRLEAAGKALGVLIEPSFELRLESGVILRAIARVAQFGSPNGMLLFGSFEKVRTSIDELTNAGYGFSVMDEYSQRDDFDLNVYIELFSDWGWAGPEECSPTWIKRQSTDNETKD